MKKAMSRREAIKNTGLSLAALGIPSALAAASNQRDTKQSAEKKVVLITGGARGIGLATAESFSRRGIDVAIFDIASQIPEVPYPMSRPEDMKLAKKRIEQQGSNCLAVQGDVRSLSDLEKAVQVTIDRFGRLDYLIANAAITQMGPLDSYSEESITTMNEVNIGGVLKSIQAVAPIFKQQNSGRIVAISSVAGRGGAYMFSLYSASKWGVIGLCKSIAQEIGGSNVTCNVVCPTFVDTKMINNTHMLSGFSPENPTLEGVSGIFRSLHALPVDLLQPGEVADVVSFLCSEETRHVTGMVFDVAAGFTAGNSA